LGEGVLYHREAVVASGLAILPESIYPPRAETVYRLGVERAAQGHPVAARDLIPIYIRPPEAEEVWQARHGSQSG
jgi:tRNA A37 threonylcarbamoyladenosine modification protein TsaB